MNLGYQDTTYRKSKLFEIGSIVQHQTGFQEGDGDGWISYGSYGVIVKTIMTVDHSLCTAQVYWFEEQTMEYICSSCLKFIC